MKTYMNCEKGTGIADKTEGKLLLVKAGEKILSLLIRKNRLFSVKVYTAEERSLVGNIYIGKITGIPSGLNAAFVDIAPGISCFLPLGDAAEALRTDKRADNSRLHPGDELLVQVVRDAVKTKQPVVSGQLSLSGNYLAATADSDQLSFSAKLSSDQRKHWQALLCEQGLISPSRQCLSSCGMIIRTNAGNLTDPQPLISEWRLLADRMQQILDAATHRNCYSCLYQNVTPYVEDLKNYYYGEFSEIITDCEELYTELSHHEQEQESAGMPAYPVRLYQDRYPLFKLYQLETRLQGALSRRVWLNSGAYLILDYTEALTVIDVNSGKNEQKKGSAEKNLAINLEAAEEILLQLRLRNLSGIILVDFINMDTEEDKSALLRHLKQLSKADPVKTTVVDITPLGLVEITRKRISRPLHEVLLPQDIQALQPASEA